MKIKNDKVKVTCKIKRTCYNNTKKGCVNMPLVSDYIRINQKECNREIYKNEVEKIKLLCEKIQTEELDENLLNALSEIDMLSCDLLKYDNFFPDCMDGISTIFKNKLDQYIEKEIEKKGLKNYTCQALEILDYYNTHYQTDSKMETILMPLLNKLNEHSLATSLENIKEVCDKLGWTIFPIEDFNIQNLVIHDSNIVNEIKAKQACFDKMQKEFTEKANFSMKYYVLAPFELLNVMHRIEKGKVIFSDVYFSEKLSQVKQILDVSMTIFHSFYQMLSLYMKGNEEWKEKIETRILEIEESTTIKEYRQELEKIKNRLQKIEKDKKYLEKLVSITHKQLEEGDYPFETTPIGLSIDKDDIVYRDLKSIVDKVDEVFYLDYYNCLCFGIKQNQRKIDELINRKEQLENKITTFIEKKENSVYESGHLNNIESSKLENSMIMQDVINNEILSPVIFSIAQDTNINNPNDNDRVSYISLCFGTEKPNTFYENYGLTMEPETKHSEKVKVNVIR